MAKVGHPRRVYAILEREDPNDRDCGYTSTG